MLPHKYSTISPYLRDKTRLFLLHSGSQFGLTELHDEHIMDRLDKATNAMSSDLPYLYHQRLHIRDYPDLKRHKRQGEKVLSDILLKDNFRQHRGISERYRRGLVNVNDIMKLSDGASRYHWAISRGYERHIVNHILGMDSEYLNRANIKPLLI